MHTHGSQPYKTLAFNAWNTKRWRERDPRSGSQKRTLTHRRMCARNEATRSRMERAGRNARRAFKSYRRKQLAARCGTPTCNRKLAQVELRLRGSEWSCADSLYHHESGWEETARNPDSGAYGIPQALPPSKMGAEAQGSGWRAALAQLRWGRDYVRGRYGSYCGAMAFWNANHWY